MPTGYLISGVDTDLLYVRKDMFLEGNLWLWGRNSGQLGDNTLVHKSSPIQTISGGTNWISIAGGRMHTAVIKTDGTLWLCGYNTQGTLGTNSTSSSSSPVQTITTGTNWKQVACGNVHTTAIKTDGTLWSWGYNAYGQLGDNTVSNKSSPVQTITGGTNWKQVSCSDMSTAAIKTDGTLWGWGRNQAGQLGDNTTVDKSSPVQTIASGTNWKQVSAGGSAFAAIKTDGTLWSWGHNPFGGLGDGTLSYRSSPVQTITGGTNWKLVAIGYYHTCAIKTDGTLWSWGYNNVGQLGDNTIVNKSSPVQTISGGANWKQVTCGFGHTTAIKTDGTLWCWGADDLGQLGDTSTTNKSSPVQTVAGGSNWTKVACGYSHTIALIESVDYFNIDTRTSLLWLWGRNTSGRLGDSTIIDKSSPVQTIAGGNNWKIACIGGDHSAAIKTDGSLWTWGYNGSGQLGDNTQNHRSSPAQTIAGGTNWKYVSCGAESAAAIKTNGTLWCWGGNSYGQLGTNNTTSYSSPIQTIAGGTNWQQVACGPFHIVATKTDGSLWTCGYNIFGQLGDNTTTNKSSPVQTVAGGTNWQQVACGEYHIVATKTDGTLWTWGFNRYGQLGDNTTSDKSSPVQTITGGNNWKIVVGGLLHTTAIKTDGTLWSCGYNAQGQLGDNTSTHKSSPVQTIAGGNNWVNSSGCVTNQVAAIKSDGTLWCWGDNYYGQLGDNTRTNKSSPVIIASSGSGWAYVNSEYAGIAAISL